MVLIVHLLVGNETNILQLENVNFTRNVKKRIQTQNLFMNQILMLTTLICNFVH